MKLQLKRSLRLSNGAAQAPSAEQMSYGEIAVNYSDTDPSIFLKDSSNVIRKLAISSLPDTSSSSAQAGTLDDRYLMLSGGTVSGDVSATNFLGGVARVATSAPASGAESELWFNSATGRLYIRYSGQWVDASPDSFTMGTDFYSKTQTDSAISTAVTALENGQVATNTTAIAGLTSDIAAEESARLAAEADKMDVAGGTFTGPVSFNEDVIVKGGAGGSGEITLNCENNSHGVKLKGPAHSAGANYTLTLPTSTGNSGEVLTTDGSGLMSWEEVVGNEISTTAPTSPSQGALWTDTSEDPAAPILKTWNGSAWVAVGSAAPSEFAPVISNVALTENDPTGDRFTSQTFDVDITMLVEGAPHSQKGLKGEVTAEFNIANETSALTSYNNSITTDVFNTPWSVPTTYHNYYRKKWWVYVGDDSDNYRMVQVYLYSSNKIYVYGYNSQDADPVLIKEFNISTVGTPYLQAMQVAQRNGILYFHGSYEGPLGNDGTIFRMTLDINNPNGSSFNCSRWDDNPGTFDGHVEWYYNSARELVARYNTQDTANWSLAKSDSLQVGYAYPGRTFGGSNYMSASGGMAYIQSHDQLVTFNNRNNRIYTEVLQITRQSTAPDSSWITVLQAYTAGLSTDGWKASWDLQEAGLFVNYWMGSTSKLAKYNPNTYDFDFVGDVPMDARYSTGLGVDRQGNLYLSGTDNNFTMFKTYRSTNGGASWQELTGWGGGTYLSSIVYSNFADAGDWQEWGFVHTSSQSVNVWEPSRLLMNQTATVTPSSLDDFGDSEKIAKYGDEDNNLYKGVMTVLNRSAGSIKLSTGGEWQNGDVVVSRDGGTSQSAVKYLVLDNVGNVTSITSVDPGYVNVGPDINHTLTFPATFPSGDAPDVELPAGTTIKVSAQATNALGSSEFGPSNIVTPS
ncbi:MAG: hypothetical protein CMM87_05460 [Rickettsiales bacterium]|nr:hypothetical protein [Rickettsiales bacterium]